MSHAEAFGHFRSFAVGLEKNARALRTVLQDESGTSGSRSRNMNKKKDAIVSPLGNKSINGPNRQPVGINLTNCCRGEQVALEVVADHPER